MAHSGHDPSSPSATVRGLIYPSHRIIETLTNATFGVFRFPSLLLDCSSPPFDIALVLHLALYGYHLNASRHVPAIGAVPLHTRLSLCQSTHPPSRWFSSIDSKYHMPSNAARNDCTYIVFPFGLVLHHQLPHGMDATYADVVRLVVSSHLFTARYQTRESKCCQ